jgi:hypothetical protein
MNSTRDIDTKTDMFIPKSLHHCMNTGITLGGSITPGNAQTQSDFDRKVAHFQEDQLTNQTPGVAADLLPLHAILSEGQTTERHTWGSLQEASFGDFERFIRMPLH